MYLGRIVSATSHLDYVCRISAPNEAPESPAPSDYAFGAFVAIEGQNGEQDLVGLVADIMLQNPDYASLGPRLAPEHLVGELTPDYVAEQATLARILLVGTLDSHGAAEQGVPLLAGRLNSQVRPLTVAEVRAFHLASGQLRLAYLPRILTLNTPLASALALEVLRQVEALGLGHPRQIALLAKSIRWRTDIPAVG
jgi:hypothetical protein